MSGYRFGLEFAGKANALSALEMAPPLVLEIDEAASIAPHGGEHVFIEGDNLAVLAALRSAYEGRVSLIYLDPPYNTGHDFVYRDSYAVSREDFLRQTEQSGEHGEPLVANPQTSGRFHSAWLAMMYPRLWACRQLLRDDGLMMCSIDDHEVHHLRVLLDEIFGEDCFIAQVVVVSNRGGRDYLRIATGHEYVLVYGASPAVPVGELERQGSGTRYRDDAGEFELRELRNRNPKFHPGNRPNLAYPIYVDPAADADGLCAVSLEQGAAFELAVEPKNSEGAGSVWRWGAAKVGLALSDKPAAIVARRRRDGMFNVYEKYRKTTRRPRALWDEAGFRTEAGTAELRRLLGASVFDHPKPVALVQRCLQLGCPPGGIVLDAFAGSGTTMQAVLEQNAADGGARRCVCIQVPERCPPSSTAAAHGWSTLTAIARARIASAWRETPGESLRWFRARPDNSPVAGEPLSDLEAEAERYWQTLERAVAQHAGMPVNRYAAALEHGVSLDAPLVHEGGWWVFRDRDSPRAVAGLLNEDVAVLPEGPPVPPQTPLVLPDRAIEAWAPAILERGLRVVGTRAPRF